MLSVNHHHVELIQIVRLAQVVLPSVDVKMDTIISLVRAQLRDVPPGERNKQHKTGLKGHQGLLQEIKDLGDRLISQTELLLTSLK